MIFIHNLRIFLLINYKQLLKYNILIILNLLKFLFEKNNSKNIINNFIYKLINKNN